jgi:hypothetical protein
LGTVPICDDFVKGGLRRKHFFSEEKKQKTFTIPPLPTYQALAGEVGTAWN